MRICMPIHGIKHCFDVPELVDPNFFHRPLPQNYPELELAATVISLVEHIKPMVKDTDFTKSLAELSNKYIQKVKEGMPKDVELTVMKVHEKAV